MTNIIRLRRRAAGGAAGAPSSLKTTEPAYNEQDGVLYLGFGDDGSGNATSIVPVAGEGAVVMLTGAQTVTGVKTFSSFMVTPSSAPSSDYQVANKKYVDDAVTGGSVADGDKGDIVVSSSGSVWSIDSSVISTFGRTLVDDANQGAARTTLGLVIGTDVQAYDAELAALAGLTSAANKGIQFTGSGTAATFDLTAAGKALLDDADSTAQLVTLGFTATITELNYIDGVTSAIQTQLDAKAPLASPSLTGTPAAPTATAGTNTTQIATTAFVQAAVDAARTGLSVKESVRVATTANITISTALNNGDTLDGVTLANGDRVLVKDQSSAAENGIYVVAASPGRATDFDASADVTSGAFVFVEEGTVNADSGWVMTTDGAITIGSTSLAFQQFSGAGQITAGDGLTKSGNTIQVVGTTNRISVAADAIDISSNYVGQTSITTLGTIGAGTWQGSTIGGAYGGLGVALSSISDGAIIKRSGSTAAAAVAGTDYLSPSSTIDGGTF